MPDRQHIVGRNSGLYVRQQTIFNFPDTLGVRLEVPSGGAENTIINRRISQMASSSSNLADADILQAQKALSRWDNEGGACVEVSETDTPELTNAELLHLRVRVIALENLIITLLAEGSDQQLEVAREMAKYISPRAGFTQHPLTVKASDHMTDMVNRAEHFRTLKTL